MGFALDGALYCYHAKMAGACTIYMLHTVNSLVKKTKLIHMKVLKRLVSLRRTTWLCLKAQTPYQLSLDGSFHIGSPWHAEKVLFQATLHADLHFQQTIIQQHACAFADVV
jgi:hypothetical protein